MKEYQRDEIAYRTQNFLSDQKENISNVCP